MPPAVTWVADLLFLSRIQEAARAQGQEVTAVRTLPQLEAALAGGARLLFIDLEVVRLPLAEALAVVRAAGGTAVGFFSHVHPEMAQQAVAAGCTQALPRSAFVRELPRLLARA